MQAFATPGRKDANSDVRDELSTGIEYCRCARMANHGGLFRQSLASE